jgi:anti-anti-sigma regulatory factor
MTFKSERRLEGRTLVLKLSGRVQAEHLEQLIRELPTDGTPTVLDLTDVTLVDVAVVRFLAASEARGVRLLGLSGFVREWIAREEKPSTRSRKRKKQKK